MSQNKASKGLFGQGKKSGHEQGTPPPVPPHPAPDYNQNYASNDQAFDQKFKVEKPKFNDIWAGLLFLLDLAGFIAVAGLCLHGLAATKGFQGGGIYDAGNTFTFNTNTIIGFVFVVLVGAVLAMAYLTLARMFTKQFIWFTAIFHVVMGIGTGIVYLVRKYYSAGIVFIVFAVIYFIIFLTW